MRIAMLSSSRQPANRTAPGGVTAYWRTGKEQTGDYFGEDDVERLEDDYQRTNNQFNK